MLPSHIIIYILQFTSFDRILIVINILFQHQKFDIIKNISYNPQIYSWLTLLKIKDLKLLEYFRKNIKNELLETEKKLKCITKKLLCVKNVSRFNLHSEKIDNLIKKFKFNKILSISSSKKNIIFYKLLLGFGIEKIINLKYYKN